METKQTLRQVLPQEALSYFGERFMKYLDQEIVSEYSMINDTNKTWPGVHRNVYTWWVLENGMAVAWNESPSKGWSFPVISKNLVKTVA